MSNGILSKLGFGEKFDFMMFFQSILVIIAIIFTVYTLGTSLLSNSFVFYSLNPTAGFANCFDAFSQIIYVVLALMLIYYSFSLSYKGKDNYYGLIMAVYAICIFRFALFQPLPINILRVIELIAVLIFIHLLIVSQNYKTSKKVMTVILVLVIICNILTPYFGGGLVPTFEVFIVQISVAFTFFVRVLRNKCPEIAF